MNRYQELVKVLGKGLKRNEPMARHTTFKIGGPADFFYEAKTERELILAVKLARELKIPYFILGGGSNVLVGDRVKGLVIKIANCELSREAGSRFAGRIANLSGETKIYAEAGVPLAKVVQFAANHSLSGLEFAAGIPGTVGGAVYGNAGTPKNWVFGKSIGDQVESVTLLMPNGRIKIVNREWMKFDYRESRLKSYSPEECPIILSVVLRFEKGEKAAIERSIREKLKKRAEKIPSEPSAGCVFKNPKGDFAGRLIEEAGLRGFPFGGAKISEKHANFIVNTGHASASDVLTLMKRIKEKVWEKFKVKLKEEIVLVGR